MKRHPSHPKLSTLVAPQLLFLMGLLLHLPLSVSAISISANSLATPLPNPEQSAASPHTHSARSTSSFLSLPILSVTMDQIEHGAWRAESLEVKSTLSSKGLSLRATLAHLELADHPVSIEKVTFHCPQLRYQKGDWHCDAGSLRVENSPIGAGSLDFDARYSPAHQRFFIKGHLKPNTSETAFSWEDRRFTYAGEALFHLLFDLSDPDLIWLTGEVSIENLNLSDETGEIGCENLSLHWSGDLSYASEEVTLSSTLEMAKGGVIYQVTERAPFAFDTLSNPLTLRLALRYHLMEDRLNIEDLTLRHPSLIDLSLNMRLNALKSLTPRSIDSLSLNLFELNLAPFLENYLLPGVDLGNWVLSGSVQGHLQYQPNQSPRASFQLSHLSVSERYFERITLEKMNGVVNLAQKGVETSSLSWEKLAFKKLETGPSRLLFQLEGTTLTLPTLYLPFSEGGVRFSNIQCFNCLAAERKIELSAQMESAPLSLFTPLIGESFPPLAGTVSLTMPQISYHNDRVDLFGEMNVGLFDGVLRVNELKVEGVTSLTPRTTASIEIDRLDLEALTQTINVGRITGRISGYIREMEWVSGVPVAFDAALFNSPGDPTRKRISQKAVDTLTEIGGAGGALAQSYLRFFEEFSYSKLGLSCRLSGDHCHLGGIDSTPQGFYILKGSGLPYISIMGDRTETSWSDLLDKIRIIIEAQSASSGEE